MNARQIKIAADAGIHFPTILPLFSSPPDKKAVQSWIEKHNQNELISTIAKKIALNINYIPFEKFLAQLKITVADFNHRVKSPYVLWIAQNYTNMSPGCSDLWVAGLAFEHCHLRWPEAIIRTDQLNTYLNENPATRDMLILDDAAYSGSHISDELSHARCHRIRGATTQISQYHLYLGIPFITQRAKERIGKNFFLSTYFLNSIQIEIMNDILNEEETRYLVLNSLNSESKKWKALTYFDHRFPDQLSTLSNLKDGDHLLSSNIVGHMKTLGYAAGEESKDEEYPALTYIKDPNEWEQLVLKFIPNSDPLVPKIIPPYRLQDSHGQTMLQTVLDKKQVGSGTLANTPESSISKIFKVHGFFKQAKPCLIIMGGMSMMQLFLHLTDLKDTRDQNIIILMSLTLLLICYKAVNASIDKPAPRPR